MTRQDETGALERKGNTRAGLTRDRILEAAVVLVDAEGLEALSMRRLGKELGVEAMSLYNHVPNKAALLDGLVDHVVSRVPIDPRQDDWSDQVRMMARSYRTVCKEHPHIVPLLSMRPFTGLKQLEPIDYAFGCLLNAGFTEAEALHAFRTLASFATGYMLAETGGSFGTGAIIEGESPDLQELGLERFEHIAAVIPEMIGCDLDEEFEFGLDSIIDGLKARIDNR
jgi:AcrR family transcriptional regulator